MTGFRTCAQACLLQLDEVADVRVLGASAFMRSREKGPTNAPLPNVRVIRHDVRQDVTSSPICAVAKNRARPDPAVRIQCGSGRATARWLRSQCPVRSRTSASIVTVSGFSMVTPASISSSALRARRILIGDGEFDPRIDAQQFRLVGDKQRRNRMSVPRQNLDHVGQVVLLAALLGVTSPMCCQNSAASKQYTPGLTSRICKLFRRTLLFARRWRRPILPGRARCGRNRSGRPASW